MGQNFFYGEVARGLLQNLSTFGHMKFLLNPNELQTQVSANYVQKNTIGGSHQWLQYTHTTNVTYNLGLVFSMAVFSDVHRSSFAGGKLDQTALEWMPHIFESYRNFLLSLLYPVGQASDPLRRSPPIALLLWPRHVAMKVVLRSLNITDRRFDRKGNPVEWEAACVFEEFRQYRLTSLQIQNKGLKRTQGLAQQKK
jgi:hypothetical protein